MPRCAQGLNASVRRPRSRSLFDIYHEPRYSPWHRSCCRTRRRQRLDRWRKKSLRHRLEQICKRGSERKTRVEPAGGGKVIWFFTLLLGLASAEVSPKGGPHSVY